jgi:hypothetical protein
MHDATLRRRIVALIVAALVSIAGASVTSAAAADYAQADDGTTTVGNDVLIGGSGEGEANGGPSGGDFVSLNGHGDVAVAVAVAS